MYENFTYTKKFYLHEIAAVNLSKIYFLKNVFESHPIIRHIKKVTSDTKFSFQHVLPWETYQTIMELNKNKATSRNIPTKTLKTIARDIYVPLTDCINSAFLNGFFS